MSGEPHERTRAAAVGTEYADGSYQDNFYLYGANGLIGINQVNSTGNNIVYTLSDVQGSIMAVADATGTTLLEEYSYDAWGRRRNPTDWTYNNVAAPSYSYRGYTMHEHIDEVELINMNGRVYDPWLALFLSPDPVIQAPGNPMNYNRYSYVMNNPLKYTDPSGYNYQPHKTDEDSYEEWHRGRDSGWGSSGGGSMGTSHRWPGFYDSRTGITNGTGLNGVYYDWVSHEYRSVYHNNPSVGWDYARYATRNSWIRLQETSELKTILTTNIRSYLSQNAKNKSGRKMGQFKGYSRHFFDYDASTGIYYAPFTNIMVNPIAIMEAAYGVRNASNSSAGWSPYNLPSEVRLALAAGAPAFGSAGSFMHFPDAISIQGSIDVVGGIGADSSIGNGKLLLLNGKGASKANYNDWGLSLGFDLGASFEVTEYYYLGPGQLDLDMFDGPRWEATGGFSFYGVELGTGVVVAPVPTTGGSIIGISYHIGISPPGPSGHVNYYGQTEVY
ncbi:RHS repeat-associated core domain-containing protein [Carboxylicivirga taeanensis]|uniref:RHS repeat-associated core domain-containing protein n=1 Tax=Carboxylicivirga taeanensis TaxID=1416875 RepID=UPI003F6DB746